MRRLILAALAAAHLLAPVTDAGTAHAPSVAHRVYPKATQAARDWAYRTLGPRQFACLDWIGHRESGWRVQAVGSTGSYGIFQAYPASKMRRFGADYRTSAMTQVKFGIAYAEKYGGPCGAWEFWQTHRWW